MNPPHQLSLGLLFSGIALILLGSLHQRAWLRRWDTSTFIKLHQRLEPHARFFAYLWPLGTTPVAIVIVLILFIPDHSVGLVVALVYFGIAIFENQIKRKIKRPRPFKTLPGISMSQPREPSDPSFPSGDAMRTWFVALLLPAIFKLSLPIWIITCAAALTISLGRTALGVHYPLDVIAGTGFGLAGAGLAFLLIGFFLYIPLS